MVDVTSPSLATNAAATTAGAPVVATLGQSVDAKVAAVESRIAALESAAKTDWAAVKSWVKANWPHFITWVSLAASSGPVVDIVKKLI